MLLCIYEDSHVASLEPIALTRPAFALWCGAQCLYERQRVQMPADQLGFWMRPSLVDLWRLEHPNQPVNDAAWLRESQTVWLNGRWLPSAGVRLDVGSSHVSTIGDQIAYAVLPAGEAPAAAGLDEWLDSWKQRLPNRAAGGAMLNYLWDVVEQNGTALREDAVWFRALHGARPTSPQVAVEGPPEQLILAHNARVEPFVFVDTRGGPVMIDRDAIVQSFSRLEGPCYIGKGSWILGAKLRANSTIGPCCRIGGEVEASIVQGYSNKYHEGFLGHSYLGEWVNLAAATQTSDLRNDYDQIRVTVNGQRIATGKHKIGAYIGDHSKSGLAALLNTGSTIGVFASILPSGALLPQVLPSFCQVKSGQLHELWDLGKLFHTAERVMQRRGKVLTDVHKDFYDSLFDATALARQKTFREGEIRRMRRSI